MSIAEEDVDPTILGPPSFVRSGRVGIDKKLYAVDGNGGTWIEDDSQEMRHINGLTLVLALHECGQQEYKQVAEAINKSLDEVSDACEEV